ncbi:MAG: protein-L-isoaspartate(D-aspartate) O-methyltransferase [Alphaproteobacteria bacterium]|nr:protein-L-isoaspartate(D-aspartate) O-methyltransferase [Alphaproteobacteria bacterium]MDE2336239.1 protein-L-isoaspartate(D-aspartate) O-methyltransferase [Alphaproteobacteria bacterium]
MSLLARKIRLIMKLRKAGITDTAVLGAIERVPREAFIPPMFHDQAYEDIALPIDCGQTISQPLVVASMTQALKVNDRHKVLEIGTGSGYQAAILSRLCRRVYSIERHRPLLATAEKRLGDLKVRNITCKAADGMKGWIEQAPFDRIIVTAAAATEPPEPLLEQLSLGGILVIPMGRDKASQFIYRITRQEEGYHCEQLMPVRFVPLLPDVARNETAQKEQADPYSFSADSFAFQS